MKRLLAVAAAVLVLIGVFLVYQGFSQGEKVEAVEVNNSSDRIRKVQRDTKIVRIEDGGFSPGELSIDSSSDSISQVTWVNEDGKTHYLNVVKDENAVFSRTLPAGTNFSSSFYEEGVYRFSSGEIEETGTLTVE